MVSLMQCLRHRPTWNRKSCLSGEAATFQLKLWQLALLIRKFCTNNSESTECCRCCCGVSEVLAYFCSKYKSSPQLVLTQRSAVDLANQITCVTVGQIEYTVSRHHMYWLRIFRSFSQTLLADIKMCPGTGLCKHTAVPNTRLSGRERTEDLFESCQVEGMLARIRSPQKSSFRYLFTYMRNIYIYA